MLIDNLYKVLKHYRVSDCQVGEVKFLFEIELNPAHKIFEGHFPQEPILPGVVSIRIIRECCELLRGEKLSYSSIKQCKFPEAINPTKNGNIKIEISLIGDNLNAEGYSDRGAFIKLKAKIK